MKIAAIFNTNMLGGAERSLFYQLSYLKNHQIELFIPDVEKKLGRGETILDFNLKNGGYVTKDFYVNKLFYSLSRKKAGMLPFIAINFILSLIFNLRKYAFVQQYDVIYVNGYKMALLFSIVLFWFDRKKRVIIHFRDYPTSNIVSVFLNYLWSRMNVILIANSNDVKRTCDNVYSKIKSMVIYNPAGPHIKQQKKEKINIIGVASMLAPWKGIHQVILFVSLYQRKLKELGIQKIMIFGDNIYHTDINKNNYPKEIQLLCEKLKIETGFIEFVGNKCLAEIYSAIDLLIHPSLEKEPFGRVIIESFASKIPVISTALGGSFELVDHKHTGFVFHKYDFAQLYDNIFTVINDQNFKAVIISQAFDLQQKIEKEIQKKLTSLI